MGYLKVFFKFIFVSSAFVLAAFYLWQNTIIDLPAVVVHSFRSMSANISRSIANVEPTVRLPVKLHRQEHSLSCEAAALKMALSTFDVHISESELISYLAFDDTVRAQVNNIWGDPNKGFVGDIDGKMLEDGYGVYWDPIADLGLRWRRTEVLESGTASQLAQIILDGNPVIAWGPFGREKREVWHTPEGKRINAADGEHARVVIGFDGDVSKPDGFIVLDPIYGEMYWGRDKFMRNWDVFDRMGVIVYPQPQWVRVKGSDNVWEISKDGTTRRLMNMSWNVFENLGGFEAAIHPITNQELASFIRGDDIY
jgi:uncharacterized protein YvpB